MISSFSLKGQRQQAFLPFCCKLIRLLSYLKQTREGMIHSYILSFGVFVQWGSFWWKSTHHVSLISDKQFAKKQQRENDRNRTWQEEGMEEIKMKWETATGQKATGLSVKARFKNLPGSSCHKANSWGTHLDQDNQSWLKSSASTFTWPQTFMLKILDVKYFRGIFSFLSLTRQFRSQGKQG